MDSIHSQATPWAENATALAPDRTSMPSSSVPENLELFQPHCHRHQQYLQQAATAPDADGVDENMSNRSSIFPASSSVSDMTSMRSSCDSSHCLVCHRLAIDVPEGNSNEYLRTHSSRLSLSRHRRRSSLGKRPPSSLQQLSGKFSLLGEDKSSETANGTPPLPQSQSSKIPMSGMRGSASAGDLAALNRRGRTCPARTSDDPMDEDTDEDDDDMRRRPRRFTSAWMRDCDRAKVAQTWGCELEHEATGTVNPVRASFSDVWHFEGPKSNEVSAQPVTKFIVNNVSVSDDGSLLAAATRAKMVHIYSIADALEEETHVGSSSPGISHKMPARVSAMEWVPGSNSILTMGDHDGVLWQMDMHSGHILHEIEEHNGDKVWSVSHSHLHPGVVASSSGMGCINIWDVSNGIEHNMCKIMAPKKVPICSLSFSKYSPNMLAMASADNNVYVYDMRNAAEPCLILSGHSRTVSFVSFQSPSRLVSSSVDGTVTLWDDLLSHRPVRRRIYNSHKNDKNFVGLSTNENGLIACGSETGSAHVYFPSWDKPVATTLPCDGFVTSVAWIPTKKFGWLSKNSPPILAVADTTGSLKLQALIRWPGYQQGRPSCST